MTDLLEGCSKSQREAITATEGYIRVVAGAGSGKTRALTHRFAYLVNEIGILPGNILCVTFTNKAANEMRQRIHSLTGDDDTGYICTFHSFCVSVLQEDSHAVGYPKSFLVLDNSDIDQMLRVIYEERGLNLRDMTFSSARDMIEVLKTVQRPAYYEDMIAMSLEDLEKKYRNAVTVQDIIFYGYLYQEKKCFGLDYNDLIVFTLHIFSHHPEIRSKWQRRLEYIMIDEFQDIDALQYRLMEVLCGYHHNLFIVGDPDQTIYTWRGASVKYLLNFDRVFQLTRTIMMTENYRSTPQILSVCNSLIGHNRSRIRKEMKAVLPDGRRPLCHHADDAAKEAAWIAGQIHGLMESGVKRQDIAVLYRAHYLTRPIEDELRRQEIPCTIYSGVPFYGRAEIKDMLSYLRMIAWKDDLSCARIINVPKRNIGEKRMKFLRETADREDSTLYEALCRHQDEELFRGTDAAAFIQLIEKFSSSYEGRQISEVLAELADASGYEEMLRTEGSQERLDNLAELKQSVYEYEVSCGEEAALPDYLRHVAIFTNSDTGDAGDRVKLMTVHAAKGLEFPYVFLCGMNEGIFPSRKIRTREAMEEERRLAFVAMTRAEKGLFLSDACGRNFDGSTRYPSRFLLEIDEDLLDYTRKPDEPLIRDARIYIAGQEKRLAHEDDRPAFRTGDRITHPVFGEGEITGTDEERGAWIVKFSGMDTERKISMRVRLQRAEHPNAMK